MDFCKMYNEKAIAYMQHLRAESDKLRLDARIPAGAIPVGSRSIRQEIKAEIRSNILFNLGKNLDLLEVEELAKAEALLWINNWNAKREYQVQIWEGAYTNEIEGIIKKLRSLMNP